MKKLDKNTMSLSRYNCNSYRIFSWLKWLVLTSFLTQFQLLVKTFRYICFDLKHAELVENSQKHLWNKIFWCIKGNCTWVWHMLGKFLIVFNGQLVVSRTSPWSWQSCQLNQPAGDQGSPGAAAGSSCCTGVMKMAVLVFSGTKPHCWVFYNTVLFWCIHIVYARGLGSLKVKSWGCPFRKVERSKQWNVETDCAK